MVLKSLSQLTNSKRGIHHLKEEDDVTAKMASLTCNIEAMELGKVNSIKAAENLTNCDICECNTYFTKDCPTIRAFQEVLHNQVNALNMYKRQLSNPTSETYNRNWRNHPNLVGEMGPMQITPKVLLRGVHLHLHKVHHTHAPVKEVLEGYLADIHPKPVYN